jgi:exonuclease SbcD
MDYNPHGLRQLETMIMSKKAIRVLHFADTHIGMENYGRVDPETGLNSRVVDYLRRMDDIVVYATQHEADLIIFAGDAFKTRTPNPTYQREFAYRIRELSQIAPIVMLIGNHDIAPAILRASSIEIYDTLGVPNVWVANEYTTQRISTKNGDVVIGTAPYPMRARILERMKDTAGMSIADTEKELEGELVRILNDLATEADQKANGDDIPRLLVGHFTVGGAVVGSERQIMLGRDVSIPKSVLADNGWDYVALGHIHKHQNLTHGQADKPPVVYSGSIERIDFGEEGDEKGFCWIELARDETEWRFVKLEARQFVTIKADLRQDAMPTETIITKISQYDLRGAVVRVLLQFKPETEARFNEKAVFEALKRAGAVFVAAIRKEVESPERQRLGENPEGLTPLELLDRYLEKVKAVSAERREELIDAAQSIFEEVKNKGGG